MRSNTPYQTSPCHHYLGVSSLKCQRKCLQQGKKNAISTSGVWNTNTETKQQGPSSSSMLCGQLINWSYLLLSRPTLGGVNIVSRLYKYYIARTVLYNAYIYNRSRVQRVMVLYNAAIVRRPAPPVHQNLRPYQRWIGVGGDQAPALPCVAIWVFNSNFILFSK